MLILVIVKIIQSLGINSPYDMDNLGFIFIGSDENAVYEVKKGNELISKLTQPNDKIDTSIITSYNIDTATEMSGYAYDVASQSNGMIIRGWNCSTTLVNHIYKENTNPNVILMGGMRQLPSNFGPLSATSTRDYDDDGLKDTEEINFEASYKGGYNLIYFEDDGTVILPTYNECMTFFKDDKFYIEKGLERFQNSSEYLTFNGDTTYVLPIKSDPTNVDGDKDGILDRYDGYKLAYNEIPDLFIGLVNEEYVTFEDLAFAGCDGEMVCCVTLSKIFNNVSISELINDVKIDEYVKKLISDELENMYLISYNDGEEDNYQTFYCEDLSLIKKLKYETELVDAIDYNNINWDNINAKYPEYELTQKAAEYAKMWIKSVEETDEMYLGIIKRTVDNTPTPMSVAYMLSGNENVDAVDEWYKGIKKGIIGAAYNLVSSRFKIPATLIIMDQQAIEYDYYYRHTYYKKHGGMPKKYSISSNLSFIINGESGAKKSVIYALDDYDTRVLQGDLESQGKYLGEYLFNVALDLATGGIQSKLDDVAEYSDDAARLTTKQIVLDETKDAISKTKGENWLDLIENIDDVPEIKIDGNLLISENNLDLNNIPNMTKQEIIGSVPNNWTCVEHNGFVHIRDEMGRMRIRIDPPDKVTLYPHVHVHDNGGNLLDIAGNIVDKKVLMDIFHINFRRILC